MGRRLEGCRASCGGCAHLWPEHRRGNVTEVSPEQLQETCPQHGSSSLPLEHPHGVRGTSSETRGPCGDTSPCACLRQNEHKRGESPKPQPDTRHQAARAAPSSQGRWLATGHHCSGWDVAVTHPRPRPSPAHLISPLGPSQGRTNWGCTTKTSSLVTFGGPSAAAWGLLSGVGTGLSGHHPSCCNYTALHTLTPF